VVVVILPPSCAAALHGCIGEALHGCMGAWVKPCKRARPGIMKPPALFPYGMVW
jgi:hypothetical protein